MFQLLLITLYAILSVIWTGNNAQEHNYLETSSETGFGTFIVQLLTYWVAYSHLIPISLYVALEIVKLGQARLIDNDVQMYDKATGFAMCRNSDLIEEMGQVEFVFSDKTGTLTQNVMEYKKCSVAGKVYHSVESMQQSLAPDVLHAERQAMEEFQRCLSVCHSVVIDQPVLAAVFGGKLKLGAQAPKEEPKKLSY